MSIEISCDTEAKSMNRKLIANFIETSMPVKRRRGGSALFLPGHECLELYEIYDKLGFKRSNLHGVTNDVDEYDKMQGVRNLNTHLMDLTEPNELFYRVTRLRPGRVNRAKDFRVFDVAYFDVYGSYSVPLMNGGAYCYAALVKDRGLFGLTWLLRREDDPEYSHRIDSATRVSGDTTYSKLHMMAQELVRVASLYAPQVQTYYHRKRMSMASYECNLKLNKTELMKDEKLTAMIHRYGAYPTKFLKTKYIGTGGSPMGTVMCKMQSFRRTDPNKVWDKIDECERAAIGQSIVVIKKRTSTSVWGATKKTKKEQPKPMPGRQATRLSGADCRYIAEAYQEEVERYICHGDGPRPADIKKIGGDICSVFDISKRQLSAIKAHMTMGTYG